MTTFARIYESAGTIESEARARLLEVGLAMPEGDIPENEVPAYRNLLVPLRNNRRSQQTKVGADPEFELVNESGELIPADTYITDRENQEMLGVDGHSRTGELRPLPGSGLFCAANIMRTLTELRSIIPSDVTARAGGGRHLPLGGHIHVSNREASLTVADFMEAYIGEPLQAAMSPRSVRRYSPQYIQTYAFREQPHGWEYRTPPSWLCSPEHTRGVLILSNLAATLDDGELKGCLANRENIFEHLTIEAPLLRAYFEALKDDIYLEHIPMLERWGLQDLELFFGSHPLVITEGETALDFLREPLCDVQTDMPITVAVMGDMLRDGGAAIVCLPSAYYRVGRELSTWPLSVYRPGDMGFADNGTIIFTAQAIVTLRRDEYTRTQIISSMQTMLGTNNV